MKADITLDIATLLFIATLKIIEAASIDTIPLIASARCHFRHISCTLRQLILIAIELLAGYLILITIALAIATATPMQPPAEQLSPAFHTIDYSHWPARHIATLADTIGH